MKKFFYMLSMLIPSIAMADSNLPEPVSGDKAMLVLQSIFGPLFGGMNDPLGSINNTYLGYVLIIGGIIAAYTALAGILGTAHDGEMLGKKFSSIWIPIKYALGVALIIPVGGNWCMGQYITANLIKTGIGGADTEWSAFLSTDNLKQIAKVNIDTPNVRDLTYKVFASQMCMAALKEQYRLSGFSDGSNIVYTNTSIGLTVEDGVINKSILFGDKNGDIAAKDACGKIEVRKVQFPDTPSVGNAANFTAYSLNVAQSTQRMLQISNQHWTQVNALVSSTGSLATSTFNSAMNGNLDVASVNTQLESAAKTYRDAIYDTASSFVMADDAFKPLQDSADKDGFIMAGAWPIQIYAMQEHVAKTVANLPNASGPTLTIGNNAQLASTAQKALEDIVANSAASQISWGVSETQGGSSDTWSNSIMSFFKKGMDVNVLARKAFSSVTDITIVGDQNIILQNKRLGNWALVVAGTSWVAGAGIAAIPVVGTYIAQTIQQLMPYILAVGFFLGYVLPMIPFLVWFGAVFGWFVSCIEAIFITPIWIAITFLDPSSGSFVGASAQGYKLLLQLLVRPIFMIFGLAVSILMIDVVGKIINTVFAQVFLISQSESSFIAFIFGAVVAYPFLYFAISLVVAIKGTALSHQIPDQMMTWLLNGSAGLGGHAEGMGGNGSVAANATMATTAANALTNKASAGGASMSAVKEPSDIAAQAKIKQAAMNSMKINDKLGSDNKESNLGKVITGKMDGGNGSDSMNQSALNSRMNNMNSMLSEDSQQKFKEAMADSLSKNSGFTDKQHMDEGFKQALNNEYGAGAGAMVKSAGNGSFDSEGAKAMAQSFKEAKSELQAASPYASEKEILGTMSKATSEAKSNFMNDKGSAANLKGGTPLSDYMNNSFERNLNLDSNADFSSATVEAPAQETPSEPSQMDLDLGEGHESQGSIPSEVPAVEEQAPFSDTAQGRFDFDSDNTNKIKDN